MNSDYDDKMKKVFLEENEKACKELMKTLETVMNFKYWGFHHAYSRIVADGNALPKVIYDSERCRVRFSLGGGDLLHGFSMSVWYGRAHAPNEESIITWNGNKCWCWHTVNEALYFLDGISPQGTQDRIYIKGQPLPDVSAQFMKSEIAQKTTWRPELYARMHALIWEKYGKRLFELFDLRRPDLWEQYVNFIVEYHKIKGSAANHPSLPAPDKIC